MTITMKRKADFFVTYLSIVAILTMLLINGCNKEDGDKASDDKSNVQLKAAASNAEFEKEIKIILTRAVEDQSISSLAFPEANTRDDGADTAVPAAEIGATADASIEVNASGTNLIEAGVDEADLVKSDGRHLFIGRQGKFEYHYYGDDANILEQAKDAGFAELDAVIEPLPYRESRVEPASIRVMTLDNELPGTKELTTIKFPARVSSIVGLYLSNLAADGKANQLIVVTRVRADETSDYFRPNNTWVVTYDVSNPEAPLKQWEFEAEGYHHASRSMNGKLYLVSSKYLWIEELIIDSTDPGVVEVNKSLIENIQVEDILPSTWVNGFATNIMKATDCMVPVQNNKDSLFSKNLLAVYTIPVNAPEQTKSFCTVESSTEVYVSPKAIYFTKGEYVYSADANEPGEHYTIIHKLSFTEDSVAYQSSARIPGWTGWRNRSFRMNELNNDLRIVVTDYELIQIESSNETLEDDISASAPRDADSNSDDLISENGSILQGNDSDVSIEIMPTETSRPIIQFEQRPVHRLYVLREDSVNENQLSVLSRLPNTDNPKVIGKPGEDIYAVRYFGDYAYIVTFRRTDPLYTINLKDPTAPFIEGELSIPGYSDYLHPINDNLLLGVGKQATESGRVQGIKIALFDVSDKSNPVTLNDMVIGKRGSDTAVSYDHHAFSILSDAETGIHKVALPVSVHERELTEHYSWGDFTYFYWSYSGLQLFEIDDGSQSSVASMNDVGVMKAAVPSKEKEYHYVREPRGVIVNDAVHYVESAEVWSAMWDKPEVVNGPN